MAGFATFLKNYAKGGFSPYSLLSAAFGKSPFGQTGFVGSLLNKYTGAGLTGAEKEANAFSAEQAQKQLDFQQQMRDTQYQSAVNDMRSAGVNPALMYGSGASGNSVPSGAMATSTAPQNGDFVGLLGQIANLSLLKAQRDNIKEDTNLKKQTALERQENIKSIRANAKATLKSIEVMEANIRKSNLESDAQEIANRFIQSEKEIGLMISGLTASEIDARISEIDAKISLLSAEEKATLQSISESRAKIRQYLSQASLNDEQRNEVKALTKKVEQETENLSKNSTLTDKDIEFYEWNHGSEISGFGVKPGTRYIPSQKQRDKNR